MSFEVHPPDSTQAEAAPEQTSKIEGERSSTDAQGRAWAGKDEKTGSTSVTDSR